MKFKHQLYNYQKDVIDVFQKEIDRWDKKIHIVAPPGSWKTIMWLEMISRIWWNHLILVPNITLQYQWKDKIEKYFLEDWENIDNIVSTSINEIKNINILTYQSLTTWKRNNDLIINTILDEWYNDLQSEFKSKREFNNYIDTLKDVDIDKYKNLISKYKKRLKKWEKNLFNEILSKKVLNYFAELKNNNIKSIVVDEAHHLTSWWSKVIYKLWKDLSWPLMIWLTATPPYDNIDFFILDDDYSNLLWEVDYYIPTPAVVKSSRLAPWSDLVYFVEPWDDLKEALIKTDKKLNVFLEKNSEKITLYIYEYIKENYSSMLDKKYKILINYLKFIKSYSNKDISPYYFDEKISEELSLEDIAKTIGQYLIHIELKWTSEINNKFISRVKKLFYELGYIWRSNNFYKFRTRIENMLVYSKSKVNWVKDILDKEIENLWNNLKCAIITDYLDDRDWIINCKYILKELIDYKKLNPILVSGQWIWKLSSNWELEELDTNILEVTKDLESGKINLVIWTRWILWEWWDCPKLNTLIDLTWIVAYMSVNQVRWRAIRLDKSNLNKVANIYDIVTYYEWYTKEVDLYRLERKHEKFYWVDDTWVIIRWVNHIYPNIKNNIKNYKDINKNMLKRSTLRSYYFKLWRIWENFQNKEVFGLDLEVKDIWRIIPFVNFMPQDIIYFLNFLNNRNLDKINWDSFYFTLIDRFLSFFIKKIIKAEKNLWSLPKDFNANIIKWQNWNFKIVSDYKWELVVKRFINNINEIFSPIINQKYVLKYSFVYFDWIDMTHKYCYFGLPKNLCSNKKIRSELYYRILSRFMWDFFLTNWMIFWYIFNIFSKSMRLIYKYKSLYWKYNSFFINGYHPIIYIYLNSHKVNKQDYIWKKPFIESRIEKVWI